MENVTRALIIAFSMIMFVVGFSYSMYLINGLTTTANTLLETVDTTKYYDNIKVSKDSTSTRTVGMDTVVSALYRYKKESYAVRIVDSDGGLIQLFDMNIESKIAKAASAPDSNLELNSLKYSIYNNKGIKSPLNERAYMFEAPWTGSDEDNRARINYFLNGTKGYINNTLVNYSKDGPVFSEEGGFLGNYGNKTFTESFVEYAYEGETISTENGLETITGSTQENSKIIITYKVN